MKILGIDPGLAETGFGMIHCSFEKISLVDYGTIKTSNIDDSASGGHLSSVRDK